MHSFFIKEWKEEPIFDIKDIRHIVKVLRLSKGDNIIGIYDNKKFLLILEETFPFKCSIVEEIEDNTKNDFELTIFMASIKTKRMELAIAKAVELNVNNFYIFYPERSQHNEKHNLERYKRIIQESAQQCKRTTNMTIDVISTKTLLEKLEKHNLNFLAHIDNQTKNIIESFNNSFDLIFNSFSVIIGPEGGFTKKDIDMFCDKTINVKLTKTILRAETAMIYLVSCLSMLLLEKLNH